MKISRKFIRRSTAQKMKFSIKDFFSKSDQIHSFLRIWLFVLKKSLMVNFIFCAVLNLKFNIVCFTETWTDDKKLENESLIQLPGYVLHRIKKNCRGEGISIFVYESLSFKKWHDFRINFEAEEPPLSIEVSNKKCKNVILNTIYRSPNRDIETCENYFKNLFAKNDTVNKYIVLAGNFNLNLLDFENNRKVQDFINLMFRYGMIPTMSHIITNVTKDTNFKVNKSVYIARSKQQYDLTLKNFFWHLLNHALFKICNQGVNRFH